MKEITISSLEAGQRFDKYLVKCLPNATKSFLYKMLRKKNITLNRKKAEGSEKLAAGDVIQMFFADETYEKFAGTDIKADTDSKIRTDTRTAERSQHTSGKMSESAGRLVKKQKVKLEVLYENDDILIINKPAGMLSQKAKKDDYSLVESISDYLLESGALTKEQLRTFHPGICNRLDRNTSGIVVAGKSIYGLQTMTAAFKERTLHKYYLCIVKGNVEKRSRVKGYLYKNERTNKVTILQNAPKGKEKDILPIETEYIPVCANKQATLLKVNLLTGRSHQIRAHLSFLGHPLAGDEKYGDAAWNQYFRKKYNIRHQMLHAYQLDFPKEQLVVTTAVPGGFCEVLKGEGLWQPGIQEDLEVLR